MNILTKYTLRCLLKNKVRTLVTIIGIVLSAALFTAVAEGAYSGQQYLLNVVKAGVGTYHGLYSGMSDDEVRSLSEEKEVREVRTLDAVGWAVAAPDNEMFPYLRIYSMSEDLTDLLAVNLVKGRMPQNENEILVSNRAASCTGAELEVGKTLTLQVGRRVSGGAKLADDSPYLGEDEELTDVTERTYTVVGEYVRLNPAVESYSLPGTLVLTVGGGKEGEHIAFFTLSSTAKVNDFIGSHRYGSKGEVNRDYLLYTGASGNRSIVMVLNGMVAILFGLILFGSVALIYNSFSISVSERTRQFGLLKSIGATKKQIRHAVITEALLLCVIGIPLGLAVGCLGIGLTLHLLKDQFNLIVNVEGVERVDIRLVPYLPALLAAAGIGLVTALISAWIPARRAVKVSPISAIRQSADIKVQKREVKTSKLTYRLFGFPGMLASKNFKRNRRRYRATVVSLFMSIVLFVSASSIADYLRRDASDATNEYTSDLIVMFPSMDSVKDPEEMLRQLSNVEGITDSAWANVCSRRIRVVRQLLSEEAKKEFDGQANAEIYASFFFLPDAEFDALCQKNGADNRGALVFAKAHGYRQQDKGTVFYTYEVLEKRAMPAEITVVSVKQIDGYYLDRMTYDDQGSPIGYVFLPEDTSEGAEPVELTVEEAESCTPLSVRAVIDELPLASAQEDLSIYLPISRQEEIVGKDVNDAPTFFFNAVNHSAAKDAMFAKLQELGYENAASVMDTRAGRESIQALLLILGVFTFGFITLISLIAAANVFNTISTNISLRRREFATLRSVGMDRKGFGRMMRFECLLYGVKALLWGLPVSAFVTWLVYKAMNNAFVTQFRLPWLSMGIAAASVFLVVGVTMIYAMHKINRENIVETLRNENI